MVHVRIVSKIPVILFPNELDCVLPYQWSVFATWVTGYAPFRLPDVRATEIDKVVMSDCFRPGDIIRAMVLSLGDSRSYYLTTAKNELGVVYAKAAASGLPLVPISWEEMQDPETHAVERRKIAKTV